MKTIVNIYLHAITGLANTSIAPGERAEVSNEIADKLARKGLAHVIEDNGDTEGTQPE